MDTIIVLTDFSPTADNALNYAIKLAETINAKIILLNFHSSNENLQAEFENRLRKNNTAVAIELLMQPGSAEEVINQVSEEKQADLVIVGMAEGTNFEETMLGINAMDMIRNSSTPVLIIPEKAIFKIPAKVVFATDYIELKNKQTLFTLLNFVSLFKAKLFIVNVMSEDEKTSSKKVASIINIKKLLTRVDHSFHYPYNDNVVNGINDFVSETDSEIVAIIPHKHNVFYRLLNLSNTKKMIFHSHVPILALPENIPVKEEPVENPATYAKIDYNIYSVYNFSKN